MAGADVRESGVVSPDVELKEFLEDALTSPDPGAVDDALEVMQAIKARKQARAGICPCCNRKTEAMADIPVQDENGKIVGYQKLNCNCAEKRATCLRCATDDALRTPFLCEWCIKVDKVDHCVLCRRPRSLQGGMCAVCMKEIVGGGAEVEARPPHSAAEFQSGLGANMKG